MRTRFIHLSACVFSICLVLGMVVMAAAQQQCSICECEYEDCPVCDACDCCPSCIAEGHGNLPPATSPRVPAGSRLLRAPSSTSSEFNFSDAATQPRSATPMQQFPQPRTPSMGFSDQAAPFQGTQPRSSDSGLGQFPSQPDFGAAATQPRSFSPTPTFPGQADFGQPDFAGQSPAASFAQPEMAQGDSGIGAAVSAAPSAAAVGTDAGAGGGDSGNIGGGNGGLSAAAIAGAADSASATEGASAPNMIGDFLNGQTTGTSFSARVEFSDFENQGTTQVFGVGTAPGDITAARDAADAARRARITNGYDGGTTGRVTVLQGVPGIVDDGAGGTFDSNDLTGASQGVEPRVQGEIISETTTGPTTTNFNTFSRTTETSEITATVIEPVSEATLLDIVEERLDVEAGTSIDEALGDFANFVDVRYVAEESSYTNRLSIVTDNSFFPVVPDTTSVSEAETLRYIYDVTLTLPAANPGEFIGRANFTDNTSPIPRDRVFFDYNFFHNARIGSAQIPMNRFTPGFEKTFRDGLMSIEARLPMAVTLSSTLTEDDNDILAYEIGDLAFALKALLYQDDRRALSIGTGVTVPTADDFNLNLANGITALTIENRSVRLTPYIGGLLRPSNETFLQGFASVDVSASGNRVFFDQDAFNGAFNDPGVPVVSSLENIGTLQSSTLMKIDVAAGRWLRRNQRNRKVTDLAAVLEGHLVTSLADPDVVGSDPSAIGAGQIGSGQIAIGEGDQSTVFNITAGTHMYFGGKNVLTLGYGVPVTEDRFFDGELRATWNRYF